MRNVQEIEREIIRSIKNQYGSILQKSERQQNPVKNNDTGANFVTTVRFFKEQLSIIVMPTNCVLYSKANNCEKIASDNVYLLNEHWLKMRTK